MSPQNLREIVHPELEIFTVNIMPVSKRGNEQTDRNTRNMKLFRNNEHTSKECLQKL